MASLFDFATSPLFSPGTTKGLMEIGGTLLGAAYKQPALAQGIQTLAKGFGPPDTHKAAQERLLAAQAAELERRAESARRWEETVGGAMGGTGIAGGGGIGSLATGDPRMHQLAMAGGGGVPMGPTPQAASLLKGGAGLMETPRPPAPYRGPVPNLPAGAERGPVQGTFPEVSPAAQGDPRNFMASLSPVERAYAGQGPEEFFNMLKLKQGQQQKAPTPTNVMKNAEALGLVPGTPEHAEYIRAVTMRPSSQVNVGVAQAPPAGYRYVYDDQGRISSMEAIPGGPAARKIAEEEAKTAEAAEMEEAQAAQARQSAGIVTQDIDRVSDLIDESFFPVTGGFSAAAAIPGTPAHDAQRLLDTVRANVGFDKLQAMRAASPTGGALGQVSERENALLQATAGNLELSQTEDQLRENLRRLKGQTMGAVHGLNPYSATVTDIQDFLETPGVEDLPQNYIDMIDERLKELRR